MTWFEIILAVIVIATLAICGYNLLCDLFDV